jgi:hypothetical protein
LHEPLGITARSSEPSHSIFSSEEMLALKESHSRTTSKLSTPLKVCIGIFVSD